MTARYAIYYAPARDSPWWEFGAHWLGRDEGKVSALPQPVCAALDAHAFERITERPRRYGFHATLKAPFYLHAHSSIDTLLARVQSLAREWDSVALGPLVPVLMGDFLALVPARTNPRVNALAQACVAGLDDLRAPFNSADPERRSAEAPDARGLELQQRFGYPHVMERFRFHMTLTGAVDAVLARQLMAQLSQPVAQLNALAPALLDRLCVFVESAPGTPFRRLADVMLLAPTRP